MNLNVFSYAWRPRYYLTYPFKFIQETIGNFRAAWMRATKGYCYLDVWNFDSYFLEVTPKIFRTMAEKGSAYPGEGTDFDTPEKWQAWLHSMADALEELKEENWEKKNEYQEDFFDALDMKRIEKQDANGGLTVTFSSLPDEEFEKLRKNYLTRAEELSQEHEKRRIEIFNELGKNFLLLWD